MLTPAHDLLQPLTLLIREPPGPHWFCHRHSRRSIPDQERVWTPDGSTGSVSASPANVMDSALATGSWSWSAPAAATAPAGTSPTPTRTDSDPDEMEAE